MKIKQLYLTLIFKLLAFIYKHFIKRAKKENKVAATSGIPSQMSTAAMHDTLMAYIHKSKLYRKINFEEAFGFDQAMLLLYGANIGHIGLINDCLIDAIAPSLESSHRLIRVFRTDIEYDTRDDISIISAILFALIYLKINKNINKSVDQSLLDTFLKRILFNFYKNTCEIPKYGIKLSPSLSANKALLLLVFALLKVYFGKKPEDFANFKYIFKSIRPILQNILEFYNPKTIITTYFLLICTFLLATFINVPLVFHDLIKDLKKSLINLQSEPGDSNYLCNSLYNGILLHNFKGFPQIIDKDAILLEAASTLAIHDDTTFSINNFYFLLCASFLEKTI